MTSGSNSPVQEAVDALYKTHYGRVVSILLGAFRDTPLQAVEDAVQDAFTSALTAWTSNGIPDNPAGWVYTASRNRLISILREGRRRTSFPEWRSGGESSGDTNTRSNGVAPLSDGPSLFDSAASDQQLRLLFACAHPDLSPKVQIVITLKYVANLKIDAIARALGMTTDGIDKLLLRARKKIRDERILLLEPGHLAGYVETRLPTVHKIIYLIFNEGYKPSSGEEAVNESLCEEALLLCKDLLDRGLADCDTAALYALMLFNAARFGSRIGPTGELLDLDEQDRTGWNRPLIALACDFFRQSRSGRPVAQNNDSPRLSSYHFEAAIAWLHCSAESFSGTNWPLISRLYLRLLRLNPNPFVELNYAIALYFAGGKNKAFEILEGLLKQPFMNGYYLLNAALGKLSFLEGDLTRARIFLSRTLEQTEHPLETAFIRRLLVRIS